MTALITGVDFVPVATCDIERAIDFYGGVLGLPCRGVSPRRTHAEFDAGDTTLQLVIDLDLRACPHPIALHVDDVATVRSVLATRGVVFTGETFDTGFCLNAPFEDPDGNALLLHRRYAPVSA